MLAVKPSAYVGIEPIASHSARMIVPHQSYDAFILLGFDRPDCKYDAILDGYLIIQ
jgi:hypothetical protein